jgi:hypothetical protein
MTNTIANPFARTDDAIDDVENVSVPDFDVYQTNDSGRIQMVSDALSRDERELFLAGERALGFICTSCDTSAFLNCALTVPRASEFISRSCRAPNCLSSAGKRVSERSPVGLTVQPTQTTLRLHGEAILASTEALCCASSDHGPFLASGCRNGCTVIYRLPDSLGSTDEPTHLHQVYQIQPQVKSIQPVPAPYFG